MVGWLVGWMPPPTSQLQSRLRRNAAALPNVPFTTRVALAMVDLIHDRLRRAFPHHSDWPKVHPEVVRFLLAGDYDDFAEYYDPIRRVWVTRLAWKDLHPGSLTISPSLVDSVLANVGQRKPITHRNARPTPVSTAMDDCLNNLAAEHVIAPSPSPLPPTMSLFLKPKDEHTARVICDLRPLNGLYPCDPPTFSLPSISAWSPPPAGGPNATSPNSTSVPTSTPSHSRRRIFAVSALPACLPIPSSSITSSSLGHGSGFLLGGAGRRLWRKHKCSTW